MHRRLNPEFAECCREALALAYPRLEDEAVRLRLAASKRLRAAVERGAATPQLSLHSRTRCPTCGHDPDDDAQFDRTMALLARWDRKERRVESQFTPVGQRQRWTFDEAIAALDKVMRGLGLRSVVESKPLPPSHPGAGRAR